MNPETSCQKLIALLAAREEWILIEPSGRSFALRREEMETTFEREKTLFGFLGEKGFQTWRVAGWKSEKLKIQIDLTRNFGREQSKIELVPRVLAAELAEAAELARIEKANKIANLIARNQPKAKLIRVSLNQETGRFAQIIFENLFGKQTAALADVSGEMTPEKLLTTAILWLEKLQRRQKNPIEKVWIVAEKKTAKDLQRLRVLLRQNYHSGIELFEIIRQTADAEENNLAKIHNLQFTDLWLEKPRKIQTGKITKLSQTAEKIIALAPAEIDVIFNKHGETLRFSGLPFARVRKFFGEEKAWFGTEAKRRILNDKTYDEFLELIENLKIYRRYDSPNKRHEFYRLAPESWLESILRKNVKALDANLILSPIHTQFRISGDRIDLLALRRDGRLVVIELKTSADREMIFQTADYWRKVELQRLSGNLQKAEIFGEMKISNEAPLVYLVAPTLSFHRDFEFLAQIVSREIEIVRFDLNEKWRENLKVMRRKVIGNK